MPAAALVAALAVLAPPPAGAARAALVERMVFDTCARVYRGDVQLADPTALAALGLKGTAPRAIEGGTIPRAETGTGADVVVIAGQRLATKGMCSVWFGGTDNAALREVVAQRARQAGYRKGPTMRLGDGTGIYKFVRTGADAQTLVVIEGDGGGELPAGPATTVIYLDN